MNEIRKKYDIIVIDPPWQIKKITHKARPNQVNITGGINNMGTRLPYTPNSKIRSALRMLFLRSRERQAAIKRDKYTCQKCGAKQSRAKGKEVFVEVHHVGGVLNWGELFKSVRAHLLCDPENMETLCVKCHEKEEALQSED